MPSGSRIVLRTAAEADIPTPDTDQVALFMDADDSDAPAYKDSGGTVTPLAGAAGTPGADGADGTDAPPLTYLDHGNAGASEAIDFTAGDVQRLVANAATVTLTYTNVPTTGDVGIVQAWLEQDGTGGRIWAFPAETDWGEVGEPDWSARAGGDVDLVTLQTVDGGSRVIATLAGRAGPAGADGADGADGAGVPAGGTTGQVLAKASNADDDTEWVDPSGGGVDPWHLSIIPMAGSIANTNWNTLFQIASGAAMFNHFLISSGAMNDAVAWDVGLSAGTWTIAIVHRNGPTSGIAHVQIDGSDVGTSDWYNGTSQENQITSITGVSISAGKRRVGIVMSTKNASSSNYYGIIGAVQLRRTA